MLAARLPRELFEKFLALQKAPLQRDVDRLKVKYYFFDESNFENYYINFKFNQVAVENSERANVVEKHRKHIVEQLLHLRCPQCNVPFGVDLNDCMSMACPMCVQNAALKNTRFCGWCLATFANSDLSHAHVRVCTRNEAPGTIYATPAQFAVGHRKRRIDLVRRYLAALPVDVDREALLGCCERALRQHDIALTDL